MRITLVAATMVALLVPAAALAKDVTVRVDARSAPWRTGANPRLAFGLGNARAPTVVVDAFLRPGVTLRIAATGTTTTVLSGQPFGPGGQAEWTADRGGALFPSHYMAGRRMPVHLNELVGAFIDADGRVVGTPFPIGDAVEIAVPNGAMALSLGINDDNYSDNQGALTVRVAIPEPTVTVEAEKGDQ